MLCIRRHFDLHCVHSQRAVDCGEVNAPRNGRVSITSTPSGATATYSCNVGYELEGNRVSMCKTDEGLWIGKPPICSGISYVHAYNPVHPCWTGNECHDACSLAAGPSLCCWPLGVWPGAHREGLAKLAFD